jgi:thiosulfate reductase cytochrome b subunit
VVLTGLAYVIWGLFVGHFRSNLFPAPEDRTWRAFRGVIAKHTRLKRPDDADAFSYNALQRAAYLMVIFVLFPLVIWTGLAMSPSFNSAFPATVNLLGGRQSARTLHFFVSAFLLLFLIVHVAMIVLAGFINRTRAMITGKMTSGRMITGEMITGTATSGARIAEDVAVPQERILEERA